MVGYRLNASHLRRELVGGSCGHESLCSIKCWEFFDWLSNYYLLTKRTPHHGISLVSFIFFVLWGETEYIWYVGHQWTHCTSSG
jgi:hypothetical protein